MGKHIISGFFLQGFELDDPVAGTTPFPRLPPPAEALTQRLLVVAGLGTMVAGVLQLYLGGPWRVIPFAFLLLGILWVVFGREAAEGEDNAALALLAATLLGLGLASPFLAESDPRLAYVPAGVLGAVGGVLLILRGRLADTRMNLWCVLIAGVALRLVLARYSEGNSDTHFWTPVAKGARLGLNVYDPSHGIEYYYPPGWYYVLGGLQRLHDWAGLPAMTFTVRAFFGFVDVLTLGLILGLAPAGKRALAGCAFFLNPCSFLLSCVHGQVEGFLVFTVLLGVWAWRRTPAASGTLWAWLGAALSNLLKHSTPHLLLVALNTTVRSTFKRALWLTLSVVVFFVILYPFITREALDTFHLAATHKRFPGKYGFSYLFDLSFLNYIFLLLLLVYPFCQRGENLVRRMAMALVFWMALTPGAGNQYFALPIAFGALVGGRGFRLYTLCAGLFLLGASNNLHVLGYMSRNVAWLAALYWWFRDDLCHTDAAGNRVLGWPSLHACFPGTDEPARDAPPGPTGSP